MRKLAIAISMAISVNCSYAAEITTEKEVIPEGVSVSEIIPMGVTMKEQSTGREQTYFIKRWSDNKLTYCTMMSGNNIVDSLPSVNCGLRKIPTE